MPDAIGATLLERAALGDAHALGALLEQHTRVDWARLAAVRALILPPHARAFDATLVIAQRMRAARDMGTTWAEPIATALESLMGAPLAEVACAVAKAVADNPMSSAELIAALAPRWSRIGADAQQRLIASAAKQEWTAMRALAALLTRGDASPPAQTDALVQAIGRDPVSIARMIEQVAAHWERLSLDAQQRLIASVAQDAWAAQTALAALVRTPLPQGERTGAGLTTDLVTSLARTIACGDRIESVACPWDRLDAHVQQRLIASAMRATEAARRALAALVRDDALAHAPTDALVQTVARDAMASAALIEDVAAHWDRLGADARQRVIAAAATDIDAAQRALAALVRDDALAHAPIDALVQTVVSNPHKSAMLIDSVAARWDRLDADVQRRLIESAAQHAEGARHALAALLAPPRQGSAGKTESLQQKPGGAALTTDHMRMLARAVARSPAQSVHLIAAIAPHWDRLDAHAQQCVIASVARHAETTWQAIAALARWRHLSAAAQQRLIASAATDADAAQRTLAVMLPHADALTPDQTMALARIAFPCAAWDALDAIPHARRAVLLRMLLASAFAAPITPDDAAAVRRAWAALDDSAQIALARAIAPERTLAIALALLVADGDRALADAARRILARAIIPLERALAALQRAAAPSPPAGTTASAIAAWLPIDPPDATERAAWRDALQGGALPLDAAAAIAPLVDRPRHPTRPWRQTH